jgi:hypothetical protein
VAKLAAGEKRRIYTYSPGTVKTAILIAITLWIRISGVRRTTIV